MPPQREERMCRKSSIWILILVSSLHLFAALSHFLLSVISKYVARDIKYGDLECVPISNGTVGVCSVAKDNQTCGAILENEIHRMCEWDFSGRGIDYQLLAGPSFMIVYSTTSILWGIIADRYHRFFLLVICSSIFGASMISTAFATEFWQLVLFRMTLAIGIAGLNPIVPGIIFDSFPERQRALAISFFHWGIFFGAGLSNGFGIEIANISSQGWRMAFFLSGVPTMVLALLTLLTGVDPPRTHKGHEGDFHTHLQHGHVTNTCPKDALNADFQDVSEDEDVVEYEIEEAERLIDKRGSFIGSSDSTSLWRCCLDPPVILVIVGACFRQTAGYTWGYNSVLYHQKYYPTFESSWWLTGITVIGGTLGVVFGGYLSDKLVSSIGLSARSLVLTVSQFLAFPFALGGFLLEPPLSFFFFMIGYFFAEMWYGVVFAIILEFLPTSYRSLGMAVILFIVNSFGGNLPVIISPLSKALSFRIAFAILYPGLLLTSSVFFFFTYIILLSKKRVATFQ